MKKITFLIILFLITTVSRGQLNVTSGTWKPILDAALYVVTPPNASTANPGPHTFDADGDGVIAVQPKNTTNGGTVGAGAAYDFGGTIEANTTYSASVDLYNTVNSYVRPVLALYDLNTGTALATTVAPNLSASGGAGKTTYTTVNVSYTTTSNDAAIGHVLQLRCVRGANEVSGGNATSRYFVIDKATMNINSSGVISIPLPAFITYYNTAWIPASGPNTTRDAIILGVTDPSVTTPNYSFSTSFSCKSLSLYNNPPVIINSPATATVAGSVKIISGSLNLANNANLIQTTNAVNSGNITVNRNSSALSRLDYTLWSSPVANQNLATFSPLTSLSPSRFYIYNSSTDLYSAIADPTTTNFTAGSGYLIRMPNTAVAAPATQPFNGAFTGIPNNGDIPYTMSTAGEGFNLVGNPYPSPITISTFVADNTNITGTLYFWRKTNGAGTAYCTWAGGVFTTNNNTQAIDPSGIIQTGQGFFVQSNGGTTLTFKNTQRVANTAGQFFRTKQDTAAGKIWLNATNTAGDFSQMAINYVANGTQGIDSFDGKYINDSPFALTSNIEGKEYTIQGRPAFDPSDAVPLNFKTDTVGNYTIAIDHTDGLFAAGQEVYLVDNTTGTETNLKTDSYTFAATTGADNSRFTLKYQKTLKTDALTFNENNVTVYKNNGTLYINSTVTPISNIQVYDIQGRLITEQKEVKATSTTINLKATNQILVVKITSIDNSVVSKKVVN